MKSSHTHSPHHDHGREKRRSETMLTAVQALFGGSVVYRLFAHFMKDDEFRGQIEKMIPKDKLPLIAAGTVAAGAVGLIGQRRAAHNAEVELGHALDEMTAEAGDLRRENERLRGDEPRKGEPSPRVREAHHERRIEPAHGREHHRHHRH